MRTRGRVTQNSDREIHNAVAEAVLEPVCLLVRLGPRHPEQIGQDSFGDAVAANDVLGHGEPGYGERDEATIVDFDETVIGETTDGLRYGRGADLEPLGKPGADHGNVFFAQLKDRLQIIFAGNRRGPVRGHDMRIRGYCSAMTIRRSETTGPTLDIGGEDPLGALSPGVTGGLRAAVNGGGVAVCVARTRTLSLTRFGAGIFFTTAKPVKVDVVGAEGLDAVYPIRDRTRQICVAIWIVAGIVILGLRKRQMR